MRKTSFFLHVVCAICFIVCVITGIIEKDIGYSLGWGNALLWLLSSMSKTDWDF